MFRTTFVMKHSSRSLILESHFTIPPCLFKFNTMFMPRLHPFYTPPSRLKVNSNIHVCTCMVDPVFTCTVQPCNWLSKFRLSEKTLVIYWIQTRALRFRASTGCSNHLHHMEQPNASVIQMSRSSSPNLFRKPRFYCIPND